MAKQQKQGPIPKGGIVTDTSYLNTPPGALTFALNTVNESEVGDGGWRSNEQSNEPCYPLSVGFIPIGQIYIGKHETIIFSVSQDEQTSEIGITNANCEYKVLVRSYLGFKLDNQISGTYRLRRGCERVLYFTTPTPMIFNIDKPEDFMTDSQWDIDKFKLFKIYEQIPNFDSVDIIENGSLPAGSYNAAIQYLDSDLNPTEWITTCEPIKIYNDSTSKEYEDIRGSTSVVDGITNFGITNKSIRFNFSNFDPSYPLYRVAIIESNTGNGLVSAVNYSVPISTNTTTYTYSGIQSTVTTGTEEEIIAFNNIISEAEYIEQIENRLVLGKVKGVQINMCNLQKYASRIQAQLSMSEIVLNQIGDNNPKTETVNFLGSGYMPGEIYSFGIVYIFEDSSLSPVYHIPGRAQGFSSLMSQDNQCIDAKYTDITCNQEYWGSDSQGQPLYDQKIRHHRFPTRPEILEPLYSQIDVLEPFFLNNLVLDIEQPILVGAEIDYRVSYKVGDVVQEYNSTIIAADYDPAVGLQVNIATSRDIITIQNIEEQVDGGGYVPVGITSVPAPSGLVYNIGIVPQEVNTSTNVFTSKIMGIRFEGIEIPSKDDTNEIGVIGYYIVRNERTEGQKTVLDSGVVTPMLVQDLGFVAHGHIYPTLADKTPIDKDLFGLIHPEHLFNGLEYRNATSIVQHGEYRVFNQVKSSVLTQDVGAGTSYNPDIHKKSGGGDYDGFSLHTLTRETEVVYGDINQRFLDPFQRGEIFYLNTLNFRSVEDTDGLKQDVYNVSGDNKIGIVKMEADLPNPEIVYDRLPYVVMNRTLANPYSTFRTLTYFKENRNPVYFDENEVDPEKNGSITVIRNGDSYITPMKYHSAVFYNFRKRNRPTKNGLWKIIVGALLVVAGVLTVAIGGAGIGLIAVGASVAAAGLGISAIASGIDTNLVAKVYQEAYEAGLRETILDDDTNEVFGKETDDSTNPPDDEMQWLSDVVTNLWFESGVNMALRNGSSIAITDFLNAPTNIGESGVFNGISASPDPVTLLDTYALEKLTTIDTDNEDGRLYKGYAGAELYLLNRDYKRTNKQKIYFHLGIEYDCCSDCLEDFPHREHYSEQSFQEELVDNYRVFLPNNYRDIEGEKGVITDTFRIQNNLYIHTQGALWHLPQNIQERVTGDIVSFIGTGDFFSVPPRKITDADKESAGTSHNWARMKTPNGTFFVSADEGKPFLFDGNSLNPIFAGNENWFKTNLPLVADYDFLTTSGNKYALTNNPSNPYGTGFVSTYDTFKERFIITKKDFKFSDRVIGGEDYNACVNNGDFIIFDDYQATIDARVAKGWTYLGIEDCKMKFSKIKFELREEERTVFSFLPSNTDVWVVLDMSGSFTNADRQDIKDAALAWETNYRDALGWTGNLGFYENVSPTNSERWIKGLFYVLQDEYPGANLAELDIMVMTFANENTSVYHGTGVVDPLDGPYAQYTADFEEFKTYQGQLKSFIGINYPIVATVGSYISDTQAFIQHSLAAYYGVPLSLAEASAVTNNLGIPEDKRIVIRDSLQGANPYADEGLEVYGWEGQWNRFSNGVDPVITDIQFANDVNNILKGQAVEETEIVEVEVPITVVEYVEGVVVDEPIEFDLSWTMSYSLKERQWVSYHSYMPNFYIYRLQEFFSWKNGDNYLYKHNRSDHYQTFYGIHYPHIIEYVDNAKLTGTKIWEFVRIQSHATEYLSEYKEDVDRDITFNKLIAYTSKQTTGLQNLIPKVDGKDYLNNQVVNNLNSIIIDRNERDWTLNDLRDIVVDYDVPLFRRDFVSLQSEYFTDKVLNEDAIDYTKDWYDLQSFRDKYLVMRLIFDNFDNIRLVTNFTEEIENKSYR